MCSHRTLCLMNLEAADGARVVAVVSYAFLKLYLTITCLQFQLSVCLSSNDNI